MATGSCLSLADASARLRPSSSQLGSLLRLFTSTARAGCSTSGESSRARPLAGTRRPPSSSTTRRSVCFWHFTLRPLYISKSTECFEPGSLPSAECRPESGRVVAEASVAHPFLPHVLSGKIECLHLGSRQPGATLGEPGQNVFAERGGPLFIPPSGATVWQELAGQPDECIFELGVTPVGVL